MKKLFLTLCALIIGTMAFAQIPMSVDGELTFLENDQEQKVYSKVKDQNNNLCALIKVSLSRPLPNPLILEVGGLGVTKSEERPDGEYWFFVPYQVKNLEFRCKGYTPIPKIPVNLRAGGVYALKIRVSASSNLVINEELTSGYLKIKLNPADAQIKIGRSKTFELGYQLVDSEGWFSCELDYGTWYYQVEHDKYLNYSSQVELGPDTPELSVTLKPNYSTLKITSEPSGATVFLDNEKLGNSPYTSDIKYKKGPYHLRVMKSNYYSLDTVINVKGEGKQQAINVALRPQFGTVVLTCEDAQAELWLDKKMVGIGTWQGELSSQRSHLVEVRKAGHQSQSVSIVVKEGGTVKKTVGAPVPLYGTLNVDTNPKNCKVFVDGTELGNSPLKQRLLVGEHSLRLERDGYKSVTESVNIEHNKTLAFKKTLEKGTVYASVSIKSGNGVKLYCDDNYLGSESWSGKLAVGTHRIKAVKEKCRDAESQITVSEKSSTQTFIIKEPTLITGSLSISGVNDAKAEIKDTEGSYSTSVYLPYSSSAFPVGTYTVYAHKTGYNDSELQYFNIEEGRKTKLSLYQRKISNLKRWTSKTQYYAPSVWELRGGLDFDSGLLYGLSYTYLPKRIGAYASFMSTNYNDNCFVVGPALRLSNWPDDIDFQLYGGAGWNFVSGMGDQMVYDFGLRMNFDDDNSWSRSSISAGCAIIYDAFYPYVGLSVGYPYRMFGDTYNTYSSVFSDLYFGFSEGDFSLGLNTSWVPTHLGAYASIMFDSYDDFHYGGGLVWRISDTSDFDFQLYGGYLGGGYEGGLDFGARFAWGDDTFGYCSFLLGVTMVDEITYFNIGCSVALALLVFANMY